MFDKLRENHFFLGGYICFGLFAAGLVVAAVVVGVLYGVGEAWYDDATETECLVLAQNVYEYSCGSSSNRRNNACWEAYVDVVLAGPEDPEVAPVDVLVNDGGRSEKDAYDALSDFQVNATVPCWWKGEPPNDVDIRLKTENPTATIIIIVVLLLMAICDVGCLINFARF